MNIFYTDKCPIKCAQNLDSKRVVKMVLETAQLLSTAVNQVAGEETSALYKSTHINHPCSIWTRSSVDNYSWLYNHFNALLNEYTYRYQKIHKCQEKEELLGWGIPLLASKLKSTGFSPPPNCAANKLKGISFKHILNIEDAYKQYLNARWKTDILSPKWSNRDKPKWYKG